MLAVCWHFRCGLRILDGAPHRIDIIDYRIEPIYPLVISHQRRGGAPTGNQTNDVDGDAKGDSRDDSAGDSWGDISGDARRGSNGAPSGDSGDGPTGDFSSDFSGGSSRDPESHTAPVGHHADPARLEISSNSKDPIWRNQNGNAAGRSLNC